MMGRKGIYWAFLVLWLMKKFSWKLVGLDASNDKSCILGVSYLITMSFDVVVKHIWGKIFASEVVFTEKLERGIHFLAQKSGERLPFYVYAPINPKQIKEAFCKIYKKRTQQSLWTSSRLYLFSNMKLIWTFAL